MTEQKVLRPGDCLRVRKEGVKGDIIFRLDGAGRWSLFFQTENTKQ